MIVDDAAGRADFKTQQRARAEREGAVEDELPDLAETANFDEAAVRHGPIERTAAGENAALEIERRGGECAAVEHGGAGGLHVGSAGGIVAAIVGEGERAAAGEGDVAADDPERRSVVGAGEEDVAAVGIGAGGGELQDGAVVDDYLAAGGIIEADLIEGRGAAGGAENADRGVGEQQG